MQKGDAYCVALVFCRRCFTLGCLFLLVGNCFVYERVYDPTPLFPELSRGFHVSRLILPPYFPHGYPEVFASDDTFVSEQLSDLIVVFCRDEDRTAFSREINLDTLNGDFYCADLRLNKEGSELV